MNLIAFTNYFTGMCRGLFARAHHPEDVAVMIRFVGEGGEVSDFPVTHLNYDDTDGEMSLVITHQV